MRAFKEKRPVEKAKSIKEKRELDDARFKALQQMIENVKDDPEGRSELVDKLF